jgi:hypothetical protein
MSKTISSHTTLSATFIIKQALKREAACGMHPAGGLS